MYISKLSLINYRNFKNTKLLFNKGINTIIGENGSGKTNLFRAIRLLLDDNMIRAAYKLDETDFHRSIGCWKGHWIIISLEFEEISQDESIQALFLHNTGNIAAGGINKATYNLIFRPKKEIRLRLSQLTDGDKTGLAAILEPLSIDDYETIFTGKSEADFNDQDLYKTIVGDFDKVKFNEEIEFPAIGAKVPDMMAIRNEISFTFIQALRDVISEFHNNRTNPLLTLLKSKSGEIDPALFKPIIDKVKDLNESIEGLPDVQTIRTDIVATIKDAAGETYSPSSLSIKSDLSDEADRLFQSLRLFIGESEEGYEGAIHELSLGGANLIYLTLKLLEFKYQKAKQSFANFLLIEEPEAHIHTHIQKTLFDRLNYADTQIIYSTHSTHISEVSNVQNMNVLGRNAGLCEAYQPATNLSPDEVGNIQRYLDAVRSNLLFAKSVILVEGDAEEILIPILVKKVLGISLDELGISLINIRSTGFENVAVLFHDTRIRKKCSIITDFDKSIIDTTPNSSDAPALRKFKEKCQSSEEAGIARKNKLESFTADNSWIAPFFAPNTFEVDFVTAGNTEKVVAIINQVYTDPDTITKAKEDIESGNLAKYGKRVLTMAKNQGKGWFAILLGNRVDYQAAIPNYILDAIFFAHPNVSKEIWFNVLSYRLKSISDAGHSSPAIIKDLKSKIDKFKNDEIDLKNIQAEMQATFPDDQINKIIERYLLC